MSDLKKSVMIFNMASHFIVVNPIISSSPLYPHKDWNGVGMFRLKDLFLWETAVSLCQFQKDDGITRTPHPLQVQVLPQEQLWAPPVQVQLDPQSQAMIGER